MGGDQFASPYAVPRGPSTPGATVNNERGRAESAEPVTDYFAAARNDNMASSGRGVQPRYVENAYGEPLNNSSYGGASSYGGGSSSYGPPPVGHAADTSYGGSASSTGQFRVGAPNSDDYFPGGSRGAREGAARDHQFALGGESSLEMRFLVLGDHRTGKTHLLETLMNSGDVEREPEITVGSQVFTWKHYVDGPMGVRKCVSVQAVDCGGQEDYKNINVRDTVKRGRGCAAAIVVFDLCDRGRLGFFDLGRGRYVQRP